MELVVVAITVFVPFPPFPHQRKQIFIRPSNDIVHALYIILYMYMAAKSIIHLLKLGYFVHDKTQRSTCRRERAN